MPLAMLLLVYWTTLISPNPSVNGIKIVTRQVTGGFTDTRTEYLAPDRLTGLVFAIFIIVVAAAEVGLALAIVLRVYRNEHTANVDEVSQLRW